MNRHSMDMAVVPLDSMFSRCWICQNYGKSPSDYPHNFTNRAEGLARSARHQRIPAGITGWQRWPAIEYINLITSLKKMSRFVALCRIRLVALRRRYNATQAEWEKYYVTDDRRP